MKKIAIVAYSAPPYSAGGIATAHFNLFRALRGKGYDARMFTFGDLHRADEEHIVRRGGSPWLNAIIQRLLHFVFKVFQPGHRAYQTSDILTAYQGARRMGRAIRDFDPDVVVLSDHGAPGLGLPRLPRAKLVISSHHNPMRFAGEPILGKFSKLDARIAVALEQRVINQVDVVYCSTPYTKDWFERTYRFDGPILVIPNLLDEAVLNSVVAQDPRQRLGLDADAVVVYMPSATSRLKGGEYWLELISRIASVSPRPLGFYVPGQAPPSPTLKDASLPPNARLDMPGQQPYAEHVAAVKACSFGISPSLIENYSMAILEAVMCGVPMLAFDTGGNNAIIQNGQNGYLAPLGDLDTLSGQAIKLLAPERLIALQKRTRAYSQRELAAENTIQAFIEMIETS
jgi:glycosyltransferase involved in cell wall biosynthesis